MKAEDFFEPKINFSNLEIDTTHLLNEKGNMQDFIKNTMKVLLENNIISKSEIENLLDNNYGYKTFELGTEGCPFALLTDDKEKAEAEISSGVRYYKDPVFANFYLCNYWRNLTSESNLEVAKLQRKKFYEWLLYIKSMENVQ